MGTSRSSPGVTLSVFLILSVAGCATAPYQYGKYQSKQNDDQPTSEVVIVHGEPNVPLDRLAWVVGIPSRILPLHAHVNNHSLSPETEDKLVKYLQENELTDVYVRVNQYDPAGEWQRLRDNERLASGWKYTAGVLNWSVYAILPGRVFGGDYYNPFTNSLYINSDVPAVVLAEAAYAKDIHARRLPGTYAAVNDIPLISLWRHVNAINDVLGYARDQQNWELEREVYRVVYPQIGIHAAGGGHTVATFVTAMPMLTIPLVALSGAVVGHTIGQTNIAIHNAAATHHSSSPVATVNR